MEEHAILSIYTVFILREEQLEGQYLLDFCIDVVNHDVCVDYGYTYNLLLEERGQLCGVFLLK